MKIIITAMCLLALLLMGENGLYMFALHRIICFLSKWIIKLSDKVDMMGRSFDLKMETHCFDSSSPKNKKGQKN